MVFSNKSVLVAKGRVSSARASDKGVRFIYEREGVLMVKSLPAHQNKPIFTSSEVVSYANDCYELDGGKLEIRGDYEYVPY